MTFHETLLGSDLEFPDLKFGLEIRNIGFLIPDFKKNPFFGPILEHYRIREPAHP